MIGKRMKFTYPPEFKTGPEYREHDGQEGVVLRQLTQVEADQGEGMEFIFKVKFDDGFIGDVWQSELSEPQMR